MTHRMILVSQDFREVKAMLTATPRNYADVAQVVEPLIRNEKGGSSNDPIGPNSDVNKQ